MERELTIREVAEATGLSAHALRYYERAGLLQPITRSEGGQRRYTQSDVDRVLFLIRLRLTGMPIHQVRRYAELTREGPATIDARREMLEAHRLAVCAQIAALEQNLQAVDYKIDLYARGWVPSGVDDPGLAELRRLCAPPEENQ